MVKNNLKDNALIKYNKIKEALKKSGIKRISKEVMKEIENFVSEEIENLTKIAKQRMLIKGKKTLGKQEILDGIAQIKKNREEYYEI